MPSRYDLPYSLRPRANSTHLETTEDDSLERVLRNLSPTPNSKYWAILIRVPNLFDNAVA